MAPAPVRLLVLLVSAMASAVAQCDPAWVAGEPVSMPRGDVLATATWDPDGVGPAPAVLVVAGSFVVGNQTTRVATWDGSQWTPLGTGLNGTSTALVVHNGELVVAGDRKVHRWTGGAWQQFGAYAVTTNTASVDAMVVWNGDLYVGGRFDTFAGFTANNVARWNGSTWSPLGAGVLSSPTWVGAWVAALAVYQNVLYVGGAFATAGGVASANLAIWNGTTWVATAGCNDSVRCLATRIGTSATNSFLFAGGAFTSVGGVPVDKVARYQGTTNTWTAMGSLAAITDPCRALLVRGTGISSYAVVAVQRERAWLWGGTAWNQLGGPLETAPPNTILAREITSIAWHAGRYVVGLEDYWGLLGGVWSLDGADWRSIDGAGIDRQVKAVLAVGDQLVIGGSFRAISGTTMHGVAIGDQGAWQPLGGGVTGGQGEVRALARLPNGDLVAAGSFSVATGGVADRIARWNGSSWQPLGAGISGTVYALAVLPDGDLVAGGLFAFAGGVTVANLARWNGSAWSNLGGGCVGFVSALATLANGDLVVGGSFQAVGGGAVAASRIARWSGGTWHALGAGVDDTIHALAASPDGGVVAGGAFGAAGGAPARRVARWNGSSWQGLSVPYGGTLTGTVYALAGLPDGDVVAGGTLFDDFGPCALRLRGTQWSQLALGSGVFGSSPDVVHAATTTPGGDVVVGGWFHRVANLVSGNVARLAVTCPASAVAVGSGCVGSGGLGVLTATTLPWDGATFRSRATGLPPLGAALVVWGFTPLAVPLAALLPGAAPGCSLHASPDILGLALPVGGALDSEVFIAPTPSLIGATFQHQVVPFEFGAGGTISTITATNGLALTVGAH